MGSIWEAGERKQAEANGNLPPLISSYVTDFTAFQQRAETSGKIYRYVDIVGVTGSIPVAPTSPKPLLLLIKFGPVPCRARRRRQQPESYRNNLAASAISLFGRPRSRCRDKYSSIFCR